MEKSVKNFPQLTDEQRHIVDGIIVIVTARLCSLLEDMDNPENYAQKFLRNASSKEKRALTYLLLNIKNPCGSKGFFPSNLNQQLAMVLAKESSQYLKGPALRKVLNVLEDKGIVFNIRGKENVEDVVGRNFNKQQKGGEYNSSKHEGQYSLYSITNDVQKLLDVMSNPVAIQIIHHALKNSGLLTMVFEKAFLAILHMLALCNSNKTAENSVQLFTCSPLSCDR